MPCKTQPPSKPTSSDERPPAASSQRAQLAGVGDVRDTEGDAPGLLRVEVAAAECASHARRRIG